jgi:hypothetical protein
MGVAFGLCGSTSSSPGYTTPEMVGTGKHLRARAQCGGGSDSRSSPRNPSSAAPCSSQQSPSSTTSGWAGAPPTVRVTRAPAGAKRQIAKLLGTDPVEVAKQDSPPRPARHKRGRENDAAKGEPPDGAERTSCTGATAPDRVNHGSGVLAAAPAAARAACGRSRAPAKALVEARECTGACAAELGSATTKQAAAALEPAAAAAATAAVAEVSWRALLAMDDEGRRRAIQDRLTDGAEWEGAAWSDEMEMRFYRWPYHPHPQPTPPATLCSDCCLRTRAAQFDRGRARRLPTPRRPTSCLTAASVAGAGSSSGAQRWWWGRGGAPAASPTCTLPSTARRAGPWPSSASRLSRLPVAAKRAREAS